MGGVMLQFVDDILRQYEPKAIDTSLDRLGVTSGHYDSSYSYGDQESLNQTYDNIVWVYRCVQFISTNLAQLPWKFVKTKDDGEEIDFSDKLEFDIFKKPNLQQTVYDFKMESVSRLELQGELFWELDRSNTINGKILAMYADWRTEEIEVLADAGKMIRGYVRRLGGKEFKFPPESVFYIKYHNPYTNLRGLSPLRAARHSSSNELNAVSFTKNFFKQGARPSALLTTDKVLSLAEEERIKKAIHRKYQGVDQMHEIAVLFGGLKWQPLNTMSMTDMQFKDLRLMNREEIIGCYGLSLEALGLGSKTYQNVKYYRRLAWTETLKPKMEKIVSLINDKFLPQITNDPEIKMKVDYSGVEALKEERSQKVKDYKMGFDSAAITPNDIRQDVFNKEPLDDPKMDMTYLPSSAGQQESQEAQEPPKSVKSLTYEDRTKLWHMKIAKYDKWERILQKEMEDYFDVQRKALKRRVPELFQKAEGEFYDTKYWKTMLEERMTPFIMATLGSAAQDVMNETGLRFDPVHPQVRQMLGEQMRKYSHYVSQTTEKEIKKLVTRALQETADLTIADKTRAIQAIFDEYFVNAKKGRAAMIARTETYRASNAGTQAGMVQGKFQRKMWITSRDDRVRDSHQIDGACVNVDAYFTLADGSSVPYPLAINERCIIIATTQPVNQ